MDVYPAPVWTCPQCHRQNQLSFKHCTDCGTKLPSATAPPKPPTAKAPAQSVWVTRGALLGIIIIASAGHFFIHGAHSNSMAAILGKIVGVYIVAQIPCLFAKKENYWHVFLLSAYILLALALIGEYARNNP